MIFTLMPKEKSKGSILGRVRISFCLICCRNIFFLILSNTFYYKGICVSIAQPKVITKIGGGGHFMQCDAKVLLKKDIPV